MNTPNIHSAIRSALLAGAALVAAALPAAAEPARHEVLAQDGSFYQLRATTYGTAFPEGIEVDSATPILALDVTVKTGECFHYIVPRSLGWELDEEEHLYVDPGSGAVFVLWALRGEGADEVHLARWAAGLFSDDFMLSDWSSASRRNLDAIFNRQVVLHNAGTIGSNGLAPVILQVVWSEQSAGSVPGARYVPVVLDRNGMVSTASLAAFDLSSLLTPPSEGCSGWIPSSVEFPTVTRDTSRLDTSHVTFYWTAGCSWVVVPMQIAEVSETRANRFLPFIGVASNLSVASAQPSAAPDARMSAATNAGTNGYAAAASWTDGGVFRYQIFDNRTSPGTWLEPAPIPLSSDVTVDKARRLVQDLLDGH